MSEALLHTPELLFSIDSTIDEESSYNLISLYRPTFILNNYYDSKSYTLEQLLYLATQFAIFSGRVKISSKQDSPTIASKVPLEVFRCYSWRILFRRNFYSTRKYGKLCS